MDIFAHAGHSDARGGDRRARVDSIAVEPNSRADRSTRHVHAALVGRPFAVLLTVLLLALATAAPVFGHAELDTSDPKDGAVLDTPPTTITLRFTEGLDASKSSFRVVLDGNDVATGRADKDGAEVMQATTLDLAPGDYVIRWTAAAEDGHIERGRLTFTVTEPTPPPASPTPAATEAASVAPSATPSPAITPAPTPAPSASAETTPVSSSGSDILLPIIAALVIVGVVGYLVLRRGRTA
jgi:methionine-rich copper-binding protein CopC